MANRVLTYGFLIVAALLLILAGAGFAGADAPGKIAIVTATQTTYLQNVNDIAYGDYDNNGTARLLANGTGADGTWVLELNNFNASSSGERIICSNSAISNMTIRLVGDSHLTGSARYDMIYSAGDLAIGTEDHGTLTVDTTNASDASLYAIYAERNVTIASGLTAHVHNTGSGFAVAVSSNQSSLAVSHADDVVVHAVGDGGITYALWARDDVLIDSSVLHLSVDGYGDSAALLSWGGEMKITGADTCIDAEVTSRNAIAAPILAYSDVLIESGARINAASSGNLYTHGISSTGGNLFVTSGASVTASAVSPVGSGVESDGLYAYGDILLDSAVVDVRSQGLNETYAIYSDYGNLTIRGSGTEVDASAVSSAGGAQALFGGQDIVIEGDSTIRAAADGTAYGYGLIAWEETGSIIISDCAMADVSGTTGSFVLKNAGNFDISSLEDTHTFQSGGASLGYDRLVSDWHSGEIEDEQFAISNYTAVTIAGKAATNQSPAPFAGILAGLGAAAVLLARIRR